MKVEKFKAVHCHASQQSENQRNDPTKKMEKNGGGKSQRKK